MKPNIPQNKKIILFDGVCNLCQKSIQYIIKHDIEDQFRFVALQSNLGKEILEYIGISIQNRDSIVLYEPGKAYYCKSNAVIQISKNLGGIFHLGTFFRILPESIRNFCYDYLAKHRYSWFGKTETCFIPTSDLKSKFL